MNKKIILFLAGVLFIIALLITAIDIICFFRPFYNYEYAKGKQAEIIGISENDLMNSTNVLLDYCQNKRCDIIVEANINGVNREVFDERETLHMYDVKKLYQNALKVRNFGLLISIILLLLFGKNNRFASYLDAFHQAFIFLIIIVLFLGGWAIIDFYSFWMNFHYLFFDNDLFLLDPNVSIMINMFPERFFFEMVIAIILLFLCFLAIIELLLRYGKSKEVSHA